jgi:hypothetical protein
MTGRSPVDEPLVAAVEALLALVAAEAAGADRALAEMMSARLREPPRLAVVGRVNVGKSTLVNALLGARVAPTDASECTRLATWYRWDTSYRAELVRRDGTRRELGWRTVAGRTQFALAPSDLGVDVERIDVWAPLPLLRELTVIDTPGLASLDDATSSRTREVLALGRDRGASTSSRSDDGADDVPAADVVFHVLRRLHADDAELLDALADASHGRPTPASAIGILARADEVGAGRLDAMRSAAAVAHRYRADPRVGARCATVLPVAGLLAEGARALTEADAAALRQLAELPAEERRLLTVSAQRFVSPRTGGVAPERRAALLDRLGLFGVRAALTRLAQGPAPADELARDLARLSGLPAVLDLVREQVSPRGRVLQAATALRAVERLARRAGRDDLLAEVERIEAGEVALSELRLVQLVVRATTSLDPAAAGTLLRLAAAAPVAERFGLDAGASTVVVRDAAVRAAETWRVAAHAPLTDGPTREIYALAARLAEHHAVT